MENIENNTLSHHGIRGQKWGVRRFQNKDGSLTAKGRKRYEIKDDKNEGKKTIFSFFKKTGKNSTDENKTTNPFRTKSVKEMTDDELRKAINRANLEKQYRDLYDRKTSRGKQRVEEMTNDELKSVVDRSNLEKRYKDLHPKKVSLGKKIIDELVVPSLKEVGKTVADEIIVKNGKKLIQNISD